MRLAGISLIFVVLTKVLSQALDQISEEEEVTTYISQTYFHNYYNSCQSLSEYRSVFSEIHHTPKFFTTSLTDILSNFGSQHCIILVDNFPGGNLPEVKYPVILRRFKLAANCYDGNATLTSLVTWVLPPEAPEFRIVEKEEMAYFKQRPLDILEHSSSTKPWNCEAHIYLFPPTQLFKIVPIPIPPFFSYASTSSTDLYQTLPSPIPVSTVLVTQDDLESTTTNTHLAPLHDNLSILDRWKSDVTTFDLRRYALLLVVKLKSCQTKPSDDPECEFDGIQLLRYMCTMFCSTSWSRKLRPKLIDVKYSDLQDLEGLAETALNFNDFPIWKDLLLSKALAGLEVGLDIKIFNCDSPRPKGFIYQWLGEEQLANVHVSLWLSVLFNTSYLGAGNPSNLPCVHSTGIPSEITYEVSVCGPRIQVESGLILESSAFPVKVVNPMRGINFVSCGQRKHGPAHKLLLVYHKSVWSILIVLLILLPNAMKKFINYGRRKITNLNSIFSLVKVLLEQGDRYLTSPQNQSRRLQILAGIYILLVTVLSITHKCGIIYNMFFASSPTPIFDFRDLIQEEFQVYTEATEINFDSNLPEVKLDMVMDVRKHEIRDGDDYRISAQSQFFKIPGELSRDYLETLKNYSSLHPELGGLLESLYNQFARELRKVEEALETSTGNIMERMDEADKLGRELVRKLKQTIPEAQGELLFKFIEKCDKNALLLSEENTLKVSMRLKRKGNIHVHVGKETHIQLEF